MKKPLVTIIIPNINGMKLNILSDCLNSLTKPDYPNWELIVVDNNSTDNSVEYLNKRFSRSSNCKVIQNPVNMYTQGVNLAAKAAKGKYLALFNNDVAIKKGYFKEMVKQMEKDENIAVGQAKLLNYYNHSIIDSAGESMDEYGNPATIGIKEKDNKQYDGATNILSACGAACIMRKSIYEKLGGYDPDYGIGYEDMDFSLRSRIRGYSVKLFPKAICYHKRATTDVADFVKVKVKWHFNKNRLATMLKDYPIGLLLRSLPVTLALYIGIAFWEWFVNKNWTMGWVRINSVFWVIANLGKILNKRNKISKNGRLRLSNNDLELFSQKPLLKVFKDFRG